MEFCNSNDSETLDGFHGGKVTYQKILIDMLKKESLLKEKYNIEELQNALKNKINRYMVYP